MHVQDMDGPMSYCHANLLQVNDRPNAKAMRKKLKKVRKNYYCKCNYH